MHLVFSFCIANDDDTSIYVGFFGQKQVNLFGFYFVNKKIVECYLEEINQIGCLLLLFCLLNAPKCPLIQLLADTHFKAHT